MKSDFTVDDLYRANWLLCLSVACCILLGVISLSSAVWPLWVSILGALLPTLLLLPRGLLVHGLMYRDVKGQDYPFSFPAMIDRYLSSKSAPIKITKTSPKVEVLSITTITAVAALLLFFKQTDYTAILPLFCAYIAFRAPSKYKLTDLLQAVVFSWAFWFFVIGSDLGLTLSSTLQNL